MIRVAITLLLLLSSLPAAMAEPPMPVHHHIEVQLDPGTRTLEATVVTTVFEGGMVTVRLAPWLTLSAMRVDGKSASDIGPGPVFEVDLGAGAPHTILFHYSGTMPAAGTQADDAPSAPAYFGPDGIYVPGGSGWLPNLGERRATYRLQMTVPDTLRAIASGRLASEQTEGGLYTAVVSNPHPGGEPSIFAGPYVVREKWHRGIRLRTYFHNELEDLEEDYLKRSAEYIDRFSDTIGDYPFADFFVISAPLPVGLGFPNLTYVGRRVLQMPFMQGRSLAHEILHNWWGNGVYVDYARGNWCEGLTTYMADYALAAERGPDEARDMRLRWLRDFAALPPDQDYPVTAFTAKTHDADQVIGYNKVAFIFHMLKREIGADAFNEGIREFWKNQRFQRAGWADLRVAFETASGRDLATFFDQWLNRSGAPSLRLVSAESDGEQITMTLGQTAPPYSLKVPIAVETDATETITDLTLENLETTASIATAERASAVTIDPDYDLFRQLDPAEMSPIFRTVTLDPRAVAIIAATGSDADAIARHLAIRLLGRHARFAPLDPPPDTEIPVLLIGTGPQIATAVAKIGGITNPPTLSGTETALAWAGQRANGAPLAIVAADDGKALAATVRALPHYGRMSYLAFKDGKVVDKGVWPVAPPPLRHTFSGNTN